MSYTAQIRLKKNGQQVHTESMTFSRKKAAEAWAKRRETELAEPGAIQRARHKGVQLSDVIDKYLEEVGRARPLGKTKKATLAAIAKTTLGTKTDRELNSQVLVDYALWRMSPEGGGVKPQTVGNDLAHLGAVLSVARPAWGYEVDGICMVEARRVLSKLGYRLKSQERDRRPTMAELDKLLQRFQEVLRPRPTADSTLTRTPIPRTSGQ